MADTDNSGWFVVQLRPNGLSMARRNLQRQGFATFSPELEGSQQRASKSVTVRNQLFPGYIFVKFDPNSSGWTAINSTRGISRLILDDPRKPRPLPASLIAGLRARCDASELISATTDCEVGDRIHILSGPFADFVTQVDELSDGERVSVLIELMGRNVRASLPRSQIRKVP